MQFIDLKQQYDLIKDKINESINNVINEANFIQGKEVKELEDNLRDYVGAKCITCANGTDALLIALRALGVKAGDEIIVPSFTWVSTAEVVKLLDAIPVFAEVDASFNIETLSIKKLISTKTKGVIAVSMFGSCADLNNLKSITEENNIFLIEDAAQSFGAKHNNIMSCSIADVSTTSFFPAKPLGCFGDGGAIFTNNNELADKINAISKHGQKGRYNYVTIGMNSRLDTIQAAVLIEKFKIFENEIFLRNKVASKYNELLSDISEITTPILPDNDNRSVWAQYTIILNSSKHKAKRAEIMDLLKSDGIPTALYYPAPIHLQKPYLGSVKVNLPFTENLSNSVLSLPMHPYLKIKDQEKIACSLSRILKNI